MHFRSPVAAMHQENCVFPQTVVLLGFLTPCLRSFPLSPFMSPLMRVAFAGSPLCRWPLRVLVLALSPCMRMAFVGFLPVSWALFGVFGGVIWLHRFSDVRFLFHSHGIRTRLLAAELSCWRSKLKMSPAQETFVRFISIQAPPGSRGLGNHLPS